jgi:hypothetical protein
LANWDGCSLWGFARASRRSDRRLRRAPEPVAPGSARRVVLGPLIVTTHASGAMTKAGADRAQLAVLASQDGLAALPARDDEITSSTRARQSSR